MKLLEHSQSVNVCTHTLGASGVSRFKLIKLLLQYVFVFNEKSCVQKALSQCTWFEMVAEHFERQCFVKNYWTGVCVCVHMCVCTNVQMWHIHITTCAWSCIDLYNMSYKNMAQPILSSKHSNTPVLSQYWAMMLSQHHQPALSQCWRPLALLSQQWASSTVTALDLKTVWHSHSVKLSGPDWWSCSSCAWDCVPGAWSHVLFHI